MRTTRNCEGFRGYSPPPKLNLVYYIYISTPLIMLPTTSFDGETKYKILASEASNDVRPTALAIV